MCLHVCVYEGGNATASCQVQMCVCMYTYMRVYKRYIQVILEHAVILFTQMCVCVCVCVCIYIYTHYNAASSQHVCVCIHVHTRIFPLTLFTFVCVCVCACTYIQVIMQRPLTMMASAPTQVETLIWACMLGSKSMYVVE